MNPRSVIFWIRSGRKAAFLLICTALLATSLVGAAAVGAKPIPEESILEGMVQGETEDEAPEGEISLLEISPVINYQGRLLQDGQPVDGVQLMLFGLYNAEFGGAPIWQEIASVTVNGGLFTHALGSVIPLSSQYFGEQLWLQVQVGTTVLPRQKLMACPYAMSVVAGGTATGWVTDRPAFTAKNFAGTGLEATSDSSGHPALKAHNSFGGPLITAWASGVKSMELDHDGNLWIKGKLTAEGGTPGPAPGNFPPPDWDSGWIKINKGETKWIPHNLGGNPDNYFVDFSFRQVSGFGRTIHGYGGFAENLERVGIYYKELDASRFIVIRQPNDPYAEEFRLRIWLYEPGS